MSSKSSPAFSGPDRRHWQFALKFVELERNATRAYLETYGKAYKDDTGEDMDYEVAAANASRLLKHDRVKQYVDQIERDCATAAQVTPEKVIARYERWASFDPSQIFSWIDEEIKTPKGRSYRPKRYRQVLTVKNPEEIPPEAWECIESISQGQEGFKINIINRKGANDMLARILGIDKQIQEHTGTMGIVGINSEPTLSMEDALSLLNKSKDDLAS